MGMLMAHLLFPKISLTWGCVQCMQLSHDFFILGQGLRIAWHALSLYYGSVIPTGEEARLFFASFGQQWCR